MLFLKFTNNRAQAVFSEYALVFVIVLAALATMAIYFKRSVQARIYDARGAAFETINTMTKGNYANEMLIEYEPYYKDTVTQASSTGDREINIRPDRNEGKIYTQVFHQDQSVKVQSETLPPDEAR